MDVHTRAKELFLACVERPQERETLLDEACADQPELRLRVEAMLAFEDRQADFLERPAIDELLAEPGDDGPQSIGKYRVLRVLSDEGLEGLSAVPRGRTPFEVEGELARGGMGVVFKGRDADLGRDVALKVLHGDLARHPEMLRRFVEEARIGGQLQHPGVVPVYELGHLTDDRPYFSMKLVEGRTLADLLAAREGPDQDRHRLLDVFEAICQTVAYAHSRGVIHRDLKPANVMVGAFGEVQVVDWGLAKSLREPAEEPGLDLAPSAEGPRPGAVMGTPAYMPPEQARGETQDLDERADVFALGAILCELLTGRPPYVGNTLLTLGKAAAADLEDATARLATCAADPELIELACRCLAAEATQRPRDAAAVAEAVQGYLTSVEDRAHRAQIEAAEARVRAAGERRARKLTLGLASSVLTTVLVVGGAWALAVSQRAARVERTRDVVAAALDEATLMRGQERWTEAVAAAQRASALAAAGDASSNLRGHVAAHLGELEGERDRAAANARRAAENAALLMRFEEIRRPEGDTVYPADWMAVDAQYARILATIGFDLTRSGVEDLAARGIPEQLAAGLDDWTLVRQAAGDGTGARRMTELAQALDPDPDRTVIRRAFHGGDVEVLQEFAGRADLDRLSPATLHLFAVALLRAGDQRRAIGVLRAARLAHPGDFVLCMDLARALRRTSPPQRAEAARHYAAAQALRPDNVEVRHELGRELYRLGELERAEALFRDFLADRPDDGHLEFHLGLLLTRRGDPAGAAAAYQRSLDLEPTARVYNNLGTVFEQLDELDAARASYEAALALDPLHVLSHANLGGLLVSLGEESLAQGHLQRALALDPHSPHAHSNLGNLLRRRGEREAAIESYQTALDHDPSLMSAHIGLGNVHGELGRLNAAVEAFRAAIAVDERDAIAHCKLGNVLLRSGKRAAAIRSFQRALELDDDFASAMGSLGWALWETGEREEALALYERALELEPRNDGVWGNLGVARAQLGDSQGALDAYAQALLLEPDNLWVLVYQGEALWKAGDRERALDSVNRALEVDSETGRAHGLLGILRGAGGDLQGSIVCFERAIALEPGQASHRRNLAISLAMSGRDAEAVQAFAAALKRSPGLKSALDADLARAHRDEAWRRSTAAVEENPKEVLTIAMRAARLEPGASGLARSRGAAHFRAGQLEEAAESLTDALADDRADPATALLLAMSLRRLGRDDEARAWLARAEGWLDAAPDEVGARLLAEARAALGDG